MLDCDRRIRERKSVDNALITIISILSIITLFLAYMTRELIDEPLQEILEAWVFIALSIAALSYIPIYKAYDTALVTCRYVEKLVKDYEENEKRIENILYEYDNRINKLESKTNKP